MPFTNLPPAATLHRRQFIRMGAMAAGALTVGARSPADTVARDQTAPSVSAEACGAEVPLAWFELAQTLVRTTPGFTPPVAARLFGYAGVALYEAVVPGMPRHRSLAGQLDGLRRPPAHGPGQRQLDWPSVANAALGGIIRRLVPTSEATLAVDALDQQLATSLERDVERQISRQSRRHGEQVAAAIFAWSTTDGGHDGRLHNFPDSYVPPEGAGLWEPTPPDFVGALQPRWGTNRTMLPGLVASAAPAAPLSYSDDPASAFFAEAREVYETVNALTEEQREIARFWSDDPGATATPAGHSISILSHVLTARRASLALAAEAFARLGIALSDGFVCCWATKYQYNVLRPVTFITAHIDPGWSDRLPLVTPPFPEHTSGHSVQSAAMSRVLTALFGHVAFTDRTHAGRGLPARSFTSFEAAAEEAAISRLYGGIHFRRAIEAGLDQGAAIGDAVNRLQFVR